MLPFEWSPQSWVAACRSFEAVSVFRVAAEWGAEKVSYKIYGVVTSGTIYLVLRERCVLMRPSVYSL